MKKLMWYDQTALVLAAVGAINWGLDALGWNAVETLLSWGGVLVEIVYYIVAIAGLYTLYLTFAE